MDLSIAKSANDSKKWDRIWETEGDDTWRQYALKNVYSRICFLINKINTKKCKIRAVDIGGGNGILADKIAKECCNVVDKNNIFVIDNSIYAIKRCKDKGLKSQKHCLEEQNLSQLFELYNLFVSTECFEHLSESTREYLLQNISHANGALISVPNNRLGPEEEPQHTVKFTALQFKRLLQKYFKYVRVEVIDGYLLGVCGEIAKKNFTLSSTLPVRDEGEDLEKTLASLMGISDQMVVGIDPRTKDNTFEVASRYADTVFYLTNPMGPPTGHSKAYCPECNHVKCKEYMGYKGINFSWVRNQCVDKCNGDWIFMTEGHEYLAHGHDCLLDLDKVMPANASIGFVLRQGNGQQWAFPWLFKKSDNIKFTRPVHNILDYPETALCVKLPQVITIHERHETRGKSRSVQRKAQNRKALLDDWMTRKAETDLFYLGQEWRDINPEKAIDRLEQFLATSNNGVQKYQARLILSKEYSKQGKIKDAYRILHGCTSDDWSRSEHFIWLGDLAYMEKEYEKAYKFYLYASTGINRQPFTIWWIDLGYYSYIPAQRLAQICGELGKLEESLEWAEKVLDLLPSDCPPEACQEATNNITIIKEALLTQSTEVYNGN